MAESRAWRGVWGLLIWTAAACPCAAQPVAQVRERLQQHLKDVALLSSFESLASSKRDLQLSNGSYFIRENYDPTVTVYSLPWSHVFHPLGKDAVGMYVEGTIGFASDSQKVGDIWDGQFAGNQTSVQTDEKSYSALLGVGPQFEVSKGLTLTPIFDVGLSYFEKNASYAGPGAAATASMFDGVLLNWRAWAGNLVGGLRLDWKRDFGDDYEFALQVREDLRWTQTLKAENAVQDFSLRTSFITLRADVIGPTEWRFLATDVRWRGTLGYREFVEGYLEGVRRYAQIGGALELHTIAMVTVSIETSVIVGENLTGYSLGLGIEF